MGRGGHSRYQHEVPHHPLPRTVPTPLIFWDPLIPPNQPSSRTAAHPGQPRPLRLTRTSSLKTRHHPIKTPFPDLTPTALSPRLPFPSLQLNKGTVTVTVPPGRPACCPLSTTDLFPTDHRGLPRAASLLNRSSRMFDGPACINCNFVRRVTVRWFNRALASIIIYWLSVMYLLVTKC